MTSPRSTGELLYALEKAKKCGRVRAARREVREDVVVRAHDEHHVLAHHAQLLALVADVVRVDRDDELGVQLLPVVHLGEEREQALVEVALEVRVLALGDERGRNRVLGARVVGIGDFGGAYCFGDGTGATCPCGNNGVAGAGCVNGTGLGARLTNSGSASIAGDDLVLSGSQMIGNQPALYFQGNNATGSGAGIQFGDGLRCAGGGVIRLQIRFSDSSGASSTTASIATKGACTAGDVKRYQIWYRDPQTSPCGAQFNLSNGVEITWVP